MIPMSKGIISAGYRTDRINENISKTGKIYEYEIDLWAASNVSLKGRKFMVEISSSIFPKFDRNPNTGSCFGMDAELKSAVQTIYCSSGYPSHIPLPVISKEI